MYFTTDFMNFCFLYFNAVDWATVNLGFWCMESTAASAFVAAHDSMVTACCQEHCHCHMSDAALMLKTKCYQGSKNPVF